MYIVLSYSAKSMTLTSTDTGSLKKFSKWNRAPKGSSNLDSVRVYLFVGTLVTIMYIHMKTPRVSNSTWGCIESCHVQPRVWPSHRLTLVPKNLSKWNRTPKGSSNFGSVRVYLFVGTLVTMMYIDMKTPRVSNSMGMYVVLSSLTKSMTLTSTDIGSQKYFKMEMRAERLVKFW